MMTAAGSVVGDGWCKQRWLCCSCCPHNIFTQRHKTKHTRTKDRHPAKHTRTKGQRKAGQGRIKARHAKAGVWYTRNTKLPFPACTKQKPPAPFRRAGRQKPKLRDQHARQCKHDARQPRLLPHKCHTFIVVFYYEERKTGHANFA